MEPNDGAALIAAERRRQVEAEGWTPTHDDEHDDESLASAAACYALPSPRIMRVPWSPADARGVAKVPREWPGSWSESWWKPTRSDRVRELVKAGALIVAEIERLQRAALTAALGARKP